MSGDLDFSGGAGGVTADLMDMRSTARVLDDRGTELAAIAGRARGLTVDGALLQSIPFSRASAARAEALLLSAATQLTLRVVRLEALATLLRTKAELLELADDAQALGGRALEYVGGYAAGALVVPLGLGAVGGGVLWFAAGTAGEGGEAVLDALRGDIGLSELAARLEAAPGEQAADMQQAAILLLRDHPGITDAVIGGLPGFVNGVAGPYAPLVPDTYEGLLGLIIAAGSPHGLFDDRPVVVRPSTPATAKDFSSLALIWDEANALHDSVDNDPGASAVRISRVEVGGVSRWIVQVPGTQQWEPRPGRDPSDVTTNLELMDDGDAELMAAVLTAMRRAGIAPDQEVMLTGHSQGGITAMAIASDEAALAEFRVITVFTGGSPIARFDLPDGVSVVAMEHVQDPVPRTDTEPNPDLPRWTTVSRDLTETLAEIDAAGRAAATGGARYQPDPIAPHSGEHYRETAALLDRAAQRAREGSTDPDDLAALRTIAALEPFLGQGVSVDFRLERAP